MLTDVLHRVAARPRVYDALQAVAGVAEVNRRVARRLAELPPVERLVDIGGGTGLAPELWPVGAAYICLDNDPLKLKGFRAKHSSGTPLIGDATRVPLLSHSIDLVVCKAVSHHIDDRALPLLFSESARLLRHGGRLVFLDAILDPDRLRSRVLWRYDRGSYARPAEVIRSAMAAEFEIEHWEEFAIHHRYVLAVGSR
ncbi:MAG TPA: class I SAM-dependent methyltransferase [Candidatus Dormibacteraeota bacterium]|nr:class I SAM-dependent methyltransferase [Candidatus Dormibacteraeota bacterium]